MLNYNDLENYALDICVPLMNRTLERFNNGITAYKPDQVGYIPAFLENFCRPFWGIAPIIANGKTITVSCDEKEVDILDYLRKVLTSGLTPGHINSWDKNYEYFGEYVYENQNITELAGLMIGIYFAKEQLWEPLTENEKELIANGLYNMAEIAFDHSWPNNHYWFPLFTLTVLKRLGYSFSRTDEMLREGLAFLDNLYIGDGWYQDGEFGRFDYYEAWSLHMYPLLWTLIADDTFEGYEEKKRKYIERTNKFLDFYTHWFAKDGSNVPFGRSLSYRFAASSLFPIAVLAGCDINPSLAGRITAKNIEFFKDNYKSESDILGEGYLHHASGVVESYTSDGGAYWCCKAFFALLIPKEHPFWDYDKAQLPSEKGDYIVRPMHKDIYMPFTAHNGDVVLYNNTTQYYQNKKHTHKFGNMACYYAKFAYSSACGFGCSTPDMVSLDNMIGLMTPDFSMTSHRLGFDDLGEKDGVLYSIHTPFYNDKDTIIETSMIPLDGGMHVRIHKVILSQPYYVMEGGFSLGRYDDYAPFEADGNYACLKNEKYKSWMTTKANLNVTMSKGETQSGFHMYAPLASYPMYKTAEPLEKGEYVFASIFGITDISEDVKLPEIKICDNYVEVEGKRIQWN